MNRRRTRGEVEIEAKLQTMQPGSERYRVLAAARDFKASWVALGELLTEVRENEAFHAWGYKSFDAYCRAELRIKADTANKLTRSFAFVRDHEPAALSERTERELPPLDVVDLLARARERSKVSDSQFDTIREEVFSPEGQALTRGEVVKRFREHDPEAFKSAPKAKPVGAGNADVRKTLLLAERVESLLDTIDGVSREAKRAAQTVTAELRSLFEDSRRQSA